jgi:hypothetical protein
VVPWILPLLGMETTIFREFHALESPNYRQGQCGNCRTMQYRLAEKMNHDHWTSSLKDVSVGRAGGQISAVSWSDYPS